jgi:hypothetical protein
LINPHTHPPALIPQLDAALLSQLPQSISHLLPNATTRLLNPTPPPPPPPHNFQSTDRSRAELAARLLRLAGVGAEVKKVKVGGRDVWRVRAYTDKLAAGREELRKALANIVR